ncbi:MAG: PEP-CTERM sorting domain-containing protein [Candidatus Scalindua sp.]|nr:PEP-CTERM sorting domain-containing protein [Candidatus Scalindua sp.]
MKRILFLLLAVIAVLCFSRPAVATLIDNGSFAYDDGANHTGFVNLIYDEDLDITWVGHGNFADETGFDNGGGMLWNDAVSWASGLTIGGLGGWRLPTTTFGITIGANINEGEMAHLFNDELGGTYTQNISTSGDPDLSLFPGLINHAYFTGIENGGGAYTFSFGANASGGKHDLVTKNSGWYALAVHDGEISAVPEPTTVALLGIGLVGLAGAEVRRRRKKRAVGKS